LFGELGVKGKPQEEVDREKVAAERDVQNRTLLQFRLTMQKEARARAAEERKPAHWE
jgi:hypothetical protein